MKKEKIQPKVSVVVPVYNVEQYLGRTMDSLLNQTLSEMEIILVDDGSPDNCPAICDEYSNKYKNVKVVHKNNGGLGMACNSGIDVASGEYIAFCDSDDYVDKEMYEEMYLAAIKNNADVVYTGIKTENENGEVHTMNEYTETTNYHGKEEIHSFAMDMIASKPSDPVERYVPMSAKVALYRKALIDMCDLHFVSERVIISEDLVWNIDVLCHAQCVVALSRTFYYYYNNTDSLSKKVRTDRFPFFKTMRETLIDRCGEYGMPSAVRQRIDRMFIGYGRYYLGNIIKSSLPQRVKYKIVAEICNDDIWNEIWKNYPVEEMPVSHRIMFLMIRLKMYMLISLVYLIKK